MLGFKKLYMQSDDKLLEDTGKEYGGELVSSRFHRKPEGKGVEEETAVFGSSRLRQTGTESVSFL